MPSRCSICPAMCWVLNRIPADAGPFLSADFKIGDNSEKDDGIPEYRLMGVGGNEGLRFESPLGEPLTSKEDLDAKYGQLIWDPCHEHPDSQFFSVAAVRLDINRDRARWSVGTSRLITLPFSKRLDRITEIWIAAILNRDLPHRSVQWDSIKLTLIKDDGYWETVESPGLPNVNTASNPRRAIRTVEWDEEQKPEPKHRRQQLVQFKLDEGIVEVQIRGQVTLRANYIYGDRYDLLPDDMGGIIHVFTDTYKALDLSKLDVDNVRSSPAEDKES